MEPDILAKPSVRKTGSPERAAGTDPRVHERSVETMSASPSSGPVVLPLSPPNGTSHGHNGHAMGLAHGHAIALPARNGHANGHVTVLAHVAGGTNGGAARVLPINGHVAARDGGLPGAARDAGLYLRFGKRLFDIVGASIALVAASPLLAVAAVLIKLESRGPVVYRSTRVGKDGRAFTFFKLRSMVNDADQMRHRIAHLNECDGPVFKISRDPRVTRMGRFLRSTSLDEIPQFVNVLRGEMSLVGPRPPIPEEVAEYEPWQMHRLDVAPGITCLWQISGRSRIGFQEWMRLDLEYIRNRSLMMDLKILLRTIPAVLSREGAY
jgi:lipopolysaccharide/colanic/teichoic acid biosynthesis glycosyltransferase